MRIPSWAQISILAVLSGLSGCSRDDSGASSASDNPFGYQDPRKAPQDELHGENDFANLIQRYSKGLPRQAPWAGYWWPFLENGIANAAAKYETATGQSGSVHWEMDNHSASAEGILPWWGHCNGWAAAAVLFPEPHAESTHSGVTFSVGDQKALLSELGQEVNADFFGLRSDTDDPEDPAFQDIFPNQFFLVLTNLVGKGQSLVMDRYTGSQVWNHPIAGYLISPVTPNDDLGTDPSAPEVYRVLVTTQVWWLRDDVDPETQTEPFTFQDGPSFDSRVLRYEVWLDGPPHFDEAGNLTSAGKVILSRKENVVYGGYWRNADLDLLNSHPDYLWSPMSLAPPEHFANPSIRAELVQKILQPGG